MTFISVLYTLIITPLELLFEVIFSIANRLIGNAGLSIIFLSLAVNFLVLPLYKKADELQAEERDIQAKMASRLKHIKSTFKGDERFFMVQEYYRINHYKPVYALKSSVSVLLQIPFFIAAYNLLSSMQGLQGMSFGFIADLGKEDAMFSIGGFPINVLPILMTLINIVSGIIYTKGHPVKEKVQVYGLAAVFLILLYRSPSGLVFYWLLNNVFSLVKNVFYKLKDPKKALNIVLAIAGLAVIISSLIRPDLDARQKVLLSAGGLLLALPLATGFIRKNEDPKAVQKNTGAFVAGTILMALITGLLIPSAVIDASALDFVDYAKQTNPAVYILNSLLLATGSWVLWGGVFYFFMSEKTKALFSRAIWAICGVSIVNYMLFGTKLGNMSSTLQFDNPPAFKLTEYLINIIAVIAVTVAFVFFHTINSKIPKMVLIIGAMAAFSIGMLNTLGVLGSYSAYTEYMEHSTELPVISLNKNGKNVIVLMLDRALGTEVPYIFNEKPELKEQFDGFTYYPNTISYGSCTINGSPSLFGGYEYTPEKLNERSSESLAAKHNEALKVMPELFGSNGFNVTICNPPFAGYKIIPDMSIYSDHPEFHCYATAEAFSVLDWGNKDDDSENVLEQVNYIRNRNFFFFSLMKISPLILQETVYDGGVYNDPLMNCGNSADSSAYSYAMVQTTDGNSKSIGYNLRFIKEYAVLNNLAKFTSVSDKKENTFLMMANDITHNPCILQEPDYVPSVRVDNTKYDIDMTSRYTVDGVTMRMDTLLQVRHYHVNMAALLKLGEWFDYLRKEGVYDNTRIILVSDHGLELEQFDIECNNQNLECFMPLLMVKDFNAKGFTVSKEYMTNADTPSLAMAGLITNAENPFTNKPFTSEGKKGPQNVFYTASWNPEDIKGNTFAKGPWYSLNGNPHDPKNWTYLGEH